MTDTLHPALRKLKDYWNSKRSGTDLPSSDSIQPFDIMPIVPHLLMVTRGQDAGWVIEWTGTGVKDILGRDLSGVPVDDVRIEPGRRTPFVPMDPDPTGRCEDLIDGEILTQRGRFLLYQRLYLPLSGKSGEISRLIGGFAVFVSA